MIRALEMVLHAILNVRLARTSFEADTIQALKSTCNKTLPSGNFLFKLCNFCSNFPLEVAKII